jgi:hypothetical protein
LNQSKSKIRSLEKIINSSKEANESEEFLNKFVNNESEGYKKCQ